MARAKKMTREQMVQTIHETIGADGMRDLAALVAEVTRGGEKEEEKEEEATAPTIPQHTLPEREAKPTEAQVARAVSMDLEEIWALVATHKTLYPHKKGEGRPTSARAYFRQQVIKSLYRRDAEDRTRIIGPSPKQRETFVASMLAQVERQCTFKGTEGRTT